MNFVKSILLAGAATVAFAGVASAADPIMPTPVMPVAPVVTAHDWSGFYAGVNAGYGWGEAYSAAAGGVLATPGGVNLNQINGMLGGAQVGFNVQHDAVVFGVEADIQASGVSQNVAAESVTVGLDYLGTVRARLGVDVGNGILPYLTAGVAYGQARVATPLGTEHQVHGGWTVGGGVEFKLDQQVSLKGEYLYYDLGERTYATALGGANAGLRGHTIRAGVNFHF